LRLIRVLFAASLLGLTTWAAAVPGLLIVRLKPEKGAVAFDGPICDYIANECQTGGKVIPIVWGVSDPIYRAAVEEGKIRGSDDLPTLQEALSVAPKLRAEYVLATDVRVGDGEILGAAYLYRGSKLLWKDPETNLGAAVAHWKELLKKKSITKEEYDKQILHTQYRSTTIQLSAKFGKEDTIRSLARTWVEMLGSGPMLGLAKQPDKPTPDPGKGETNTTTGPGPAPKPADDARWAGEAAAALRAGDPNKAISILRDAVDASPMDVSRRLLLIKTLMQVGQPEVAAREARRAAELMPDHLEFRSLAARAWIQAENVDEAQTDLKEAVSRAPESAETRVLLANVAIAKGETASAIDNLNKAIATAPTGEAYYLRGLAHAMAGETDAAVADAKKATEMGLPQDPPEAEARYGLVAAIFDDRLAAVGGEIRTLHQKALVQRQEKEVKDLFEDLSKRVNGRSKFISELPVPQGHETSHNRRVLAYKLLSQCLTDLDSYLKSGDEDVLTESRINLGEALKQAAGARQQFKMEQQGTKKSDAKSG
jgi:tetratricopeptide (TPR) repeat protein